MISSKPPGRWLVLPDNLAERIFARNPRFTIEDGVDSLTSIVVLVKAGKLGDLRGVVPSWRACHFDCAIRYSPIRGRNASWIDGGSFLLDFRLSLRHRNLPRPGRKPQLGMGSAKGTLSAMPRDYTSSDRAKGPSCCFCMAIPTAGRCTSPR